jgi:hypothetical protein
LIARLATSVNQLSDALNSSAHEVMLMNVAQESAVRATDELIGSLQQMNETVMNALTDINATAIRVNQTIGANFYSFYSIFISLAGATVLSCEDHIPLSLYLCRATDCHEVKQISLLHLVASTVVRLLWTTLQHLPSFLVMVSRLFQLSRCAWMIRL